MDEKIPTVRIEMHDLPDLILSKEYYDEMGKYKGFLKHFGMSIRKIKKVHHILMCISKYPTQAWEG